MAPTYIFKSLLNICLILGSDGMGACSEITFPWESIIKYRGIEVIVNLFAAADSLPLGNR